MGQNQFAGNVLQILLSWLQSLISSVWSLFSGGGGGSILNWFSQNWLGILVVLMVIGMSANIIVYLLRWRPFWWWFRKKRFVVDDEIFEDAPVKHSKSVKRKTKPSTIVPRRDPSRKPKNDDMFMTPTLFDVNEAPKKRRTAPPDARSQKRKRK